MEDNSSRSRSAEVVAAVPMAVLRAPSIARSSNDGSCRTDAEEPSTTDTSPAATPPRPCLAAATNGQAIDCRVLYDAFFPHDAASAAAEDEDEDGAHRRQPPRPRSTTADPLHKRLRCATPSHHSGAVTGGLAALPGECMREVAGFLPAADLWPGVALVCRRVSCHPALVPVLAAACPRALLPGAIFGLWTGGPLGPEEQGKEAPAPCRDVQTLNLAGLPLGAVGGRRLARALGTAADGLAGLRALDLASCGLDGAGTEALARALGQCRLLESLRLSGNGVGDRGVGALGRALRAGACPRLQVRTNAG